MEQEDFSKLSDLELLEKAKEMKRSSTGYAFVIGLMAGLVLYSIFNFSWGLVTLIPLYFIWRLMKGAKNNDALKLALKERGLK